MQVKSHAPKIISLHFRFVVSLAISILMFDILRMITAWQTFFCGRVGMYCCFPLSLAPKYQGTWRLLKIIQKYPNIQGAGDWEWKGRRCLVQELLSINAVIFWLLNYVNFLRCCAIMADLELCYLVLLLAIAGMKCVWTLVSSCYFLNESLLDIICRKCFWISGVCF